MPGVAARPRLVLCSNEVADGGRLRIAQRSGLLGGGGLDVSPSLLWTGAPVGTLSYAVTATDSDGRCHWAVADVSGGVTSLVVDAGNGTGERLPSLARQLRNDYGLERYVGRPRPAPGCRDGSRSPCTQSTSEGCPWEFSPARFNWRRHCATTVSDGPD
ncbi:hypothetical protein [Williamsia sp.]|uniref:hypothetical protein n=1 Tax=Williamsia sp. TaxID=1872085 RepID=UPI002F922466